MARLNNYGITQDCDILMEAARESGAHASAAPTYRRNWLAWVTRRREARRVLFVERIYPPWLKAADEAWLIPNQERFPHRQVRHLKRIDRVLAKTHHAMEIFAALGVSTRLLGFTSRDCRVDAVAKDWGSFLHVAGASTLKGTDVLLQLWSQHPEWPELVLIQKQQNAPRSVPSNVRLISGYLSEPELRVLQNRCGIHLCPSRSEGWGHHIVEALSTGAVVVTTDAPPMNEHVDASCGVPVPYLRATPRHLGVNFDVDPAALEAAIIDLVAMPVDRKKQIGAQARRRFETIDGSFRSQVKTIFGAGASAEDVTGMHEQLR